MNLWPLLHFGLRQLSKRVNDHRVLLLFCVAQLSFAENCLEITRGGGALLQFQRITWLGQILIGKFSVHSIEPCLVESKSQPWAESQDMQPVREWSCSSVLCQDLSIVCGVVFEILEIFHPKFNNIAATPLIRVLGSVGRGI